jgi:hypothetical protein
MVEDMAGRRFAILSVEKSRNWHVKLWVTEPWYIDIVVTVIEWHDFLVVAQTHDRVHVTV